MDIKPKIAIIFYTTYLHIFNLAEAIREGAEKSGTCEIKLYQVPETLSQEDLVTIKAPTKPEFPVITSEILKEYDGFLFGYSTRYGSLPAQYTEFFDSCGDLCEDGTLNGKMAGAFCSASDQHGGHESSFMSLLTIMAHFGMIFVPLGYATPHLSEDVDLIGGSPWGASVIAGRDEMRQPSVKELEIAHIQGEMFSKVLSRYHGIPVPEIKLESIPKEEVSGAAAADLVAPVKENSESAPAEILTSVENKEISKGEVQAPVPAPATKDTLAQEPPQDNDLVKKPNSKEVLEEGTGAPGGQSIKNANSKESVPTNKTTSGLKKFFKRLSTRPKTGDGN